MGGYNIFFLSRGDVGGITDIHVDQGACLRGEGVKIILIRGRKGLGVIVSY